jgi:ABC-type amino acid transport substrate-binding protein
MNRARLVGVVVLAVAWMTASGAGAEESALAKVKKDGVLKVCFAQGTPDNYKDPKTGEWVGVMVDLVNELASWMKVKVEKVEVQWDVAVLSLKRGDCDLFGASLIYNAPRAMEINYVRPFWAKGMDAAIPKAIPVWGDLRWALSA